MSDPEPSGRRTPEPGKHSNLNRSETISTGGAARRRIFDAYDRVVDKLVVESQLQRKNKYAYKNIDYDTEIRVLKIYPGMPGTDVTCCLETRSLFDHKELSENSKHNPKIPYTALSYYWGENQQPKNKIYILETDEAHTEYAKYKIPSSFVGYFYVQDNLFAALRQLRSSTEDVYLWADAVCINQMNIKERTAQVANMHEVYLHAKDVYVWLGPGIPSENKRTFDFLKKILDLQELELLVYRLARKEREPTWNEDLRDCKNAIDLMKVEWFGRRWIIQELALATNPYVLQGQCSMPWSDFADAIALFMTKYEQIRLAFQIPKNYYISRNSDDHHIRALDAKALGANILVTTTSNLFRRSKDGMIKRRLLSLETLVSSMLLAFEATDPKDTIFAILKIAKDTYVENSSAKNTFHGFNTVGIVCRYVLPVLGIIFWKADILSLLPSDKNNYAVELSSRSPSRSATLGISVIISYCIMILNLILVWMIYLLLLELANKLYNPFAPSRDGSYLPAKTLDKRIEPEYQKCLRDVCADFIEYCIDTAEDKSRSLDILCRHWAPPPKPSPYSKMVEMPSWILPIEGNAFGGPRQSRRGRVNGDSLVGGAERRSHFTASGNLHPHIKFGMTNAVQEVAKKELSQEPGEYTKLPLQPSKEFPPRFDGSLEVKGFRLGVIEECELVNAGIISPQALKLCGWSREEGFTDLDCFWRILVANRGPDGTNAPSWYRRACSACLEWYKNDQPEDFFNTNTLKNMEGTPSGKVAFLDRVQRVVWNRRIIRARGESNKPLLGLAPTKAKVKDVICIFYGCSVPVVIRPIEGTKEFTFLGESYVHEMMDGEAVETIPKNREEWFKLR